MIRLFFTFIAHVFYCNLLHDRLSLCGFTLKEEKKEFVLMINWSMERGVLYCKLLLRRRAESEI